MKAGDTFLFCRAGPATTGSGMRKARLRPQVDQELGSKCKRSDA
jgi:hypothetical protein